MGKIYLFGSNTVSSISPEIEGYIKALYEQGHEFIVGDTKGADTAFHMSLSRIGALDRTTIYCMDKAKNNNYGAKERSFKTSYDEETKTVTIFEEVLANDKNVENTLAIINDVNQIEDIPGTKEYYEFKDRLMIKECDIAICIWNGETKNTLRNIQLMNIFNKPCYTYNVGV